MIGKNSLGINFMSNGILTDLEELAMLAIIKLGPNKAYGVAIAEAIEEATGRRIGLGALYTALGRLHRNGLIKAEKGEPIAARGGRAKSYYSIQALGKREMQAMERGRHALRQTPLVTV